ncbi:MAG: hypothetical protein EBR81_04320 [Proteobacteria bacterium]|nr:hypothetical protein [Pseudomonadota bacterium]
MPLPSRYLPHAAALVCLVAPCVAIAASESSPEGVLTKGLADLLRLARSKSNNDPVELAHRVRPTIERFFNLESLTRKALGPGWKEFTPAQQKPFSFPNPPNSGTDAKRFLPLQGIRETQWPWLTV